jgi:hypothetical protein
MSRLNAPTLLTQTPTRDNALLQPTVRQITTLILLQKVVNLHVQIHPTLETLTQLRASLCVRKYLNNTLRVVIAFILALAQDLQISKIKENVT